VAILVVTDAEIAPIPQGPGVPLYTVPFTAAETYQAISLSAPLVSDSPDDTYRLEIYMNTVNIDLCVDRTVVA